MSAESDVCSGYKHGYGCASMFPNGSEVGLRWGGAARRRRIDRRLHEHGVCTITEIRESQSSIRLIARPAPERPFSETASFGSTALLRVRR